MLLAKQLQEEDNHHWSFGQRVPFTILVGGRITLINNRMLYYTLFHTIAYLLIPRGLNKPPA